VKVLKELAKMLSKASKSTLPEKLLAIRKRHYNMALATAADGATNLVIEKEVTKCKHSDLLCKLVIYTQTLVIYTQTLLQ
jgi:hypothetical protein